MATKSFLFNNNFQQQGGLAFTLDRNWATVSPGGMVSPAATSGTAAARFWHHSRLLCGAAAAINEPNLTYNGDFNWVSSAGVGLDSTTPMLAWFQAQAQSIRIHMSTLDNGPNKIHDKKIDIPTNDTTRPPAKRGQSDLLIDEIDANDTLVHETLSYTVCHGLVLATCQVKRFLGNSTFNIVERIPIGIPNDPNNSPVFFDYRVEKTSGANTPDPLTFTASLATPTANPLGVAKYVLIADQPSGYPASQFRLRVNTTRNENIIVDPYQGIPSLSITNWEPFATALCYWQETQNNGQIDRGWKLYAMSEPSQPGNPRSSEFMSQGYRILDTGDVTKVWFAFSNYVTKAKAPFGGEVFLVRAFRNAVGDPWTLDLGIRDLPAGSYLYKKLPQPFSFSIGTLPDGYGTQLILPMSNGGPPSKTRLAFVWYARSAITCLTIELSQLISRMSRTTGLMRGM